ncbi:MAG: hypothetical protein RLZZ352_2079 [Pseudomonadota bacterium]|jgi:hypothetical protein
MGCHVPPIYQQAERDSYAINGLKNQRGFANLSWACHDGDEPGCFCKSLF